MRRSKYIKFTGTQIVHDTSIIAFSFQSEEDTLRHICNLLRLFK